MAKATEAAVRRGTSSNGMDFVTYGDGARSLLFLPGGPPSTIPSGWGARWAERRFAAYVARGYTAWQVTRRRGMPLGHAMADIAADHARFIREQLGGRVDVVVGESLGGLVAQHLAGRHPDLLERLVLVASGWRVSGSARAADGRMAAAVFRGDRRAAGAAFGEYLIPGERWAWLRQQLGPLTARLMFPAGVPFQDVAVEADAERSCDTRDVLPNVDVPVLILAGPRDRFFPPPIIEETARLLPDARVIWYPGGHFRVCGSGRIAGDVLTFAAGRSRR